MTTAERERRRCSAADAMTHGRRGWFVAQSLRNRRAKWRVSLSSGTDGLLRADSNSGRRDATSLQIASAGAPCPRTLGLFWGFDLLDHEWRPIPSTVLGSRPSDC